MTFPNPDSRHGQTLYNPGQYSYCDYFWVIVFFETLNFGLITFSLAYLG